MTCVTGSAKERSSASRLLTTSSLPANWRKPFRTTSYGPRLIHATMNLYGNLGVDYIFLGEYEKAVAASLQDLRLNPGSAAAYTNLVGLYSALDRLHDGQAKYQEAMRAQD